MDTKIEFKLEAVRIMYRYRIIIPKYHYFVHCSLSDADVHYTKRCDDRHLFVWRHFVPVRRCTHFLFIFSKDSSSLMWMMMQNQYDRSRRNFCNTDFLFYSLSTIDCQLEKSRTILHGVCVVFHFHFQDIWVVTRNHLRSFVQSSNFAGSVLNTEVWWDLKTIAGIV
jgi:hypothetical protein